MSTTLDNFSPTVIRAAVHFASGSGDTPVAMVAEPGTGLDDHSGDMSVHEIEIHDARPMIDNLALDRHRFCAHASYDRRAQFL